MLSEQWIQLMGIGVVETLYMTVISTCFAYVLGLPLGMGLVYFAPEGLRPHALLYRLLNILVNVFRSIPFLILMIFVSPLTRAIVRTTLGSKAVIVPLVISAAPFVGRLIEQSFLEVGRGVLEAAVSMGATHGQIFRRVYIGESLPSLVNGMAIAMTTILGYSAMAGALGGGGLGALAITYGYERYQTHIMLITIVLLVVIVQIIHWLGNRIALAIDKR